MALSIMPVAAIANADDLQALARYLAVQQARPDTVAFMFDVTIEELIAGEEDGEQVELSSGGSFRVNPAMPAGSRVTILNPPAEETASFDRAVEDFQTSDDLASLFWCGYDASQLEENAAKSAEQLPQAEIIWETEDEIAFRLAPPEKIVLEREDFESNSDFKRAKKAARFLVREAAYSLETGQQIHSRLYITKSFKPSAIARIHTMNNELTCEFLPEVGASFRQSSTVSLDATALGVISVTSNTRIVISNVQPLPSP